LSGQVERKGFGFREGARKPASRTSADIGGHLLSCPGLIRNEPERSGTKAERKPEKSDGIRIKSGSKPELKRKQTGKIKTQGEGEIMKRPVLNEIALDEAMSLMLEPMSASITVSPGQWDVLLQAAYDRGWILLEVENERLVRAFRRLKA